MRVGVDVLLGHGVLVGARVLVGPRVTLGVGVGSSHIHRYHCSAAKRLVNDRSNAFCFTKCENLSFSQSVYHPGSQSLGRNGFSNKVTMYGGG